jgi:hypothetical protein
MGLKRTTQKGCGVTLGVQWRAMQREAQLAAEHAAHGVTVLGRANHAQTGLYTQAFFGLSIGLERMGKLSFLADHAIRSDGVFPTDQDLRKIGHDLASLLAKCEAIGAGLSQNQEYMARPSDAIHRGIEDVVSLFATKLRCYNLNHLSGAAQGQQDRWPCGGRRWPRQSVTGITPNGSERRTRPTPWPLRTYWEISRP